MAQTHQPEQLLMVSRLQEHSGWSGSVTPALTALLQPHESHSISSTFVVALQGPLQQQWKKPTQKAMAP